jgi:Ran GTPase-activating protein (RanGAP) involved in mRNA processing and transport
MNSYYSMECTYAKIDVAIQYLLNNEIIKLQMRSKCDNINDFIKLCNALKQNTSLNNLVLCQGYISNNEVEILCNMLKENNTIEILDVADNKIGPLEVKLLSEMLKQNTTLKSIYLTTNLIGDEGIQYICDALKQNSTLITLLIGHNRITKIGIKTICGMIKINKTLNELYASDLIIDKDIYDALMDNRSLTRLYFQNKTNAVDELCMRNMHNLELKNMSLLEFLDK